MPLSRLVCTTTASSLTTLHSTSRALTQSHNSGDTEGVVLSTGHVTEVQTQQPAVQLDIASALRRVTKLITIHNPYFPFIVTTCVSLHQNRLILSKFTHMRHRSGREDLPCAAIVVDSTAMRLFTTVTILLSS